MNQAPTEERSTGGRITLRYWASLRAAAAADGDDVLSEVPLTLAELKKRARDLHDSRRFADVLASCSVLVEERPVSTSDPSEVTVWPGQSVEFLPPFAGG